MRPSSTKRLIGLIVPIPLVLAATACGPQPGTNATSSSADTRIETTSRASRAQRMNEALRSAAEPFEAVTEQAPTASWDRLDSLIGKAVAAVRSVRPGLGGTSAATIDRQLAALRTSRSAQDRIGIAMAAVESYRALVEAQDPGSADPPIPVSLLDYAGFRYDALARSSSPDWREMLRLTEFARQQWLQVAPKLQSRALPGVVDSALDAMASAAERQDSVAANKSAAVELALVDLIEEAIAVRPAAGAPAGR